MNFGVMPIHQEYGILGQTPGISPVLAAVSREQFALSIKKQ
jgi:cobalt-precorrin-5B (C1)-methyltransferase